MYCKEQKTSLDIDDIRNALESYEANIVTPLDRVIVKALKELIEYKDIGLIPQAIKDMDKMYLEKCQQVNRLTCTCEMYERMANMDKQDLYTLCTLIPTMDDYSGHNMYLCGKRDGFNECVQTLKENLESISEEQGHES